MLRLQQRCWWRRVFHGRVPVQTWDGHGNSGTADILRCWLTVGLLLVPLEAPPGKGWFGNRLRLGEGPEVPSWPHADAYCLLLYGSRPYRSHYQRGVFCWISRVHHSESEYHDIFVYPGWYGSVPLVSSGTRWFGGFVPPCTQSARTVSELNPHQTFLGLLWLRPGYPTTYRAVPRWIYFYVKWAGSLCQRASPVSEFVLVAKPKHLDQLSSFWEK